MIVALASCLFSPAAYGSDITDSVQIVSKYLRLALNHPNKANVLLEPDTIYIMYDTAGPLNRGFPQFLKALQKLRCSKPLVKNQKKTEDEAQISGQIVNVEWRCSKQASSVPTSFVLQFFVEKQKIFLVIFGSREERKEYMDYTRRNLIPEK